MGLNNLLQDKIQREAVQAWIDSGKYASIVMATGTGKTFVFLHALHSMKKNDDVHVFIAEVVDREKDLDNDIIKYDKLFGTNTYKDYDLKFSTYQSMYKVKDYKFGLVCCDEAHFHLSPEYYKFHINNEYKALLCITATTESHIEYEIDGKIINKGQLLDKIAPICFTYTIAQAKKDGIGRLLNIYVIETELDSVNKTIKAGNAKKPFYQTEKAAYEYWDKEHKRSWFIEDKELKEFKIRTTATKRSQILYNLPSKITNTKILLNNINGKSIIFGNSLDSLIQVTPNVISSRNSDDKNNLVRKAFENDEINDIGSFKKLLQGINLPRLDNCILMSYYTSEGQAVQRLGRLRKNGDKVGSVFIFLTKDTQEVKWYNSMIQELSEFNFIKCEGIDDCIKQYKLNETN